MSDLPDHIADSVIAYLRQENKDLDEGQARLDIAAAIRTAACQSDSPTHSRGAPPSSLYILAVLMAPIIFHHTGKLLSRSMTGGPYSELLRDMANGSGLVNSKTGDGYSLQQATDAIQSVQRALNKALGLEKLKFKRKDDLALSENESADDYNDTVNAQRNSPERKNVRGDSLETHVICEDDDGQPVFGGYEAGREQRPGAEVFKEALARLSKSSKN